MIDWLLKYPLEAYRTATLEFALGVPVSWLFGAFAVGVVLLGIGLTMRSPLPAGKRAAIGTIQAAILALALLVVAQPELVDEQPVAGSNRVVLVLDDSASMAYRDAGETRIDSAKRWLAETAATLADTYAVETVILSDPNGQRPDAAAATAVAPTSTIAQTIAALVDSRHGQALAGVVVATDGLDTGAGNAPALASLGNAGVPVYGRLVGRTAVAEDLALTEVSVPPTAVAGARFDATVTVRHDAPGTARLRVLANNDTLLASTEIDLEAEQTLTQATVPLSLPDTGFHALRFSLTPIDGEQQRANNDLERVVEVPADTYRILYFEGEPRWEYKFLRRALDLDSDIQVTSLLRVSPNKYYRQGLNAPDELAAGFPSDAEALYPFQAIMIGSVEAAALTPAQHELLHDYVSVRGGTLMLLAGKNGLGDGGWGESALGPALPTTLPAFGRDSYRRLPGQVSLTAYGQSLPTLNIGESGTAGWDDLPQIADQQSVGEPKPAATTWLTVRTSVGQQPLLVSHRYGRGTSYVLGTGGTWRWQMRLPVEDQRHERFWRQLLRTLVSSAAPRQSLRAVASGSAIELEAEFLDDEWQPQSNLRVEAATGVGSAAGTMAMTVDPERPGIYRGELPAAVDGVHYVEVVALRGDESLGSARTAFAGIGSDFETRRVRANDDILQAMARATAGAVIDSADTTELKDRLSRSVAGVTEQRRRSVWDAPALLLGLLGLKALEWLLRRRWRQI
ncbi:MAG: hypothetical protein AAGH76_05250 [Pseudomonadota bacterium]